MKTFIKFHITGIIFLVLMLLFSCSSNEAEDKIIDNAEPQKYEVLFNVSKFSQTIEDLKSSGSTDLEGIQSIYYSVSDINYDSVYVYGEQYKLKHESFGKIKLHLPDGEYYITVAASDGITSLFPPEGTIIVGSSSSYDNFATRIKFEVKGNTVTQDVTLERIVGNLNIVISDEIPEDVMTLSVELKGELEHTFADTYYFAPTTAEKYPHQYTSRYPINIPEHMTPDNRIISLYLIEPNPESKVTVTVSAFKGGNEIARKVIPNVLIYKNKKTTLTGLLFDNTENNYNVNVNQTWDNESINMTF